MVKNKEVLSTLKEVYKEKAIQNDSVEMELFKDKIMVLSVG